MSSYRPPFSVNDHAITVPVDSSRRDWFWILRQLMAAGISMGAVARKVNRNPATVAGWANGGDPKEADARVVLALLAKYAPDAYREQEAKHRIRLEDDAKDTV